VFFGIKREIKIFPNSSITHAMEARRIRYLFYTYLILILIIIDLLTNINFCTQIPVDIFNYISNIDYVSIILPTIIERRPAPLILKRWSISTQQRKILNSQPLPQQVTDALTGNMLGDGWIGFNKKKDPNPTGEARYAMTLKNKAYITHLWSNIYAPICTSTVPCPWPNPKTGLPASQYTFQTLSLVPFTILHKVWYSWSPELTKYVKIIPLNIGDLLTPIGLALWIQDDGTRNGNGLVLCTECYTLAEVELLICVLRDNFGLKANIQKRNQKGKFIGWRIYITSENRAKLISLVKPYFIPSMLYKLGL